MFIELSITLNNNRVTLLPYEVSLEFSSKLNNPNILKNLYDQYLLLTNCEIYHQHSQFNTILAEH